MAVKGALTPRRIKRYGWRPDHPDHRDLLFAAPVAVARKLPPRVDLRATGFEPPIFDQGQLGSCTGNGIAAIHQFVQAKEGEQAFTPSRLFIYYGERVLENSVSEDAGAEIRDGMKVIAHLGVPPEDLWPYDIAKFADKPPQVAYDQSVLHQALTYRRVLHTNARNTKLALAAGYPVVFGFTVFQSFETREVARSGLVPMPGNNEEVLGGHCTVIVGYLDDQQPGDFADLRNHFIVRNSWGTGWGQQGYCFMPYEYLSNPQLSSDFWTLSRVE